MTGEVVAWATALLSAIASVLAWAARLWWGREFAAAKDETIKAKEAQLGTKDETIKAKDAQIEGLTQRLEQERELNPMKIREYFKYMKLQLEEYNNVLQGQLGQAQQKLSSLQTDIEAERSKAAGRQDEIAKLVAERDTLQTHTSALIRQIANLKTKQSESAGVLINYDSLLTYSDVATNLAFDIAKFKVDWPKLPPETINPNFGDLLSGSEPLYMPKRPKPPSGVPQPKPRPDPKAEPKAKPEEPPPQSS